MTLTDAREKLNNLKALRQHKKNRLDDLFLRQKSLKCDIINVEKSRELITGAAKMTQDNVRHHLTSIVSLALQTVLPDPPDFVAEIMNRRNQTEIDLMVREGSDLISPYDAVGGGAIDLIAFSLRISLWLLKSTRKVFILDEPFRNVSHIYQDKVGELLSLLAEKLNIQFIIVSHQKLVDQYADRIFNCKMINKKSYVEVK